MMWQLPAEHIHLLRATLCRGETGRDAYRLWRTTVDFERLDVASYRLLPLLYRNLQANAVDDPLMARLGGVYKRTWLECQLLFQRVEALLAAPQLRAIDAVWVGEAALAQAFCVRPLGHVTVNVPAAARACLGQAAGNAGWHRDISPHHLQFALTNRLSVFRSPDGHTLRIITRRAADALAFLLCDPIGVRPINRLVFFADLFHLMQEVDSARFSQHAAVRMLREVIVV